MGWDWQKLLEKKNSQTRRGDRSFGPLMAERSRQEQRPAGTGATTRGLAAPRGVAGMVWRATDAIGRTGESLTESGLLQLRYGEEHDCAFCRAAGQICGGHRCPVCRGAATVAFIPPVVRCVFCSGGGHMPRRSSATCPACRGSGLIRVRPPIQVCTKCKGSGRQTDQSVYCTSCRGSGVVTVSKSKERSNTTSSRASRRLIRPAGTTPGPRPPRGKLRRWFRAGRNLTALN